MPLILDNDSAEYWLDSKTNTNQMKSFLRPYEDSCMKALAIHNTASNTRLNNNYKEVLDPYFYQDFTQQSLF